VEFVRSKINPPGGKRKPNASVLGQFQENRPSPEGTTERITPASWNVPVPKFTPFASGVLFACLRGRSPLRGSAERELSQEISLGTHYSALFHTYRKVASLAVATSLRLL